MSAILDLVDRKEAAALLGVSTKTIDRLRAAGEVQSVLVHRGSVRIVRASLQSYLERQLELAPTAPSVGDRLDLEFPIPALEEAKWLKQVERARRLAPVAVGVST